VLHRGVGVIFKENFGGRANHTVNNNRKAKSKRVVPVCKKRGDARILLELCYNSPMSAKRTKGRWVVYERRKRGFISLSRLFTTSVQAEKERDKLKATFTYKTGLARSSWNGQMRTDSGIQSLWDCERIRIRERL